MKRAIPTILAAATLVATSCSYDPFSLGARNRTSPALESFDSCVDLHAALKDGLNEELRIQLISQLDYASGGGGIYYSAEADGGGDMMATGASNDSSSSRDGGTEGVDYSGTNNQETGVDEADFVKTDGRYIYVLNGSRLEILGAPEVGDLEAVSTTELEGWPSEMLIGDDRVVVFSSISVWDLPDEHPLKEKLSTEGANEAYGYDYYYSWWFRSDDLTKISVVDTSDAANPDVVRELYVEGSYQTARRVDSTVRMVNYGTMDIPGVLSYPDMSDYWDSLDYGDYYYYDYDEDAYEAAYRQAIIDTIIANEEIIAATELEDFLPQIYERLNGSVFIEHAFSDGDCRTFAMADDGVSRGVTSILSLDLLGDAFSFDHDHIITNSATVYASKDVMLVAEASADWWWYWNNEDYDEATNIHRFDISGDGLAVYTGSGRIDGRTNDQFSFSEYEGFIRVAATTGGWWDWWNDDADEIENHVYVLGGTNSLEQLGHLGGIAEGEEIWSSRFVEDKAYLVTFLNVDPLWTIDLSSPISPVIMGELEVPGVSTYIHPLGDDHLLTIGYSGDDWGMDWNAQVSLFDVSDFSNPTLADTLPFAPPSSNDGWYSAWSEALYEHKAFTYWQGYLAIPLSTYRDEYDDVTGEYSYEYISRLQLVTVDTDTGLAQFGDIDHSEFFNDDDESYYWWYGTDVRRAIFMLDDAKVNHVYAVSERGVTAHRIDGASLVPTGSLALPGPEESPYFWW